MDIFQLEILQAFGARHKKPARRLKELRSETRFTHIDISCISIYAFSFLCPSTITSLSFNPLNPSASAFSLHHGISSEKRKYRCGALCSSIHFIRSANFSAGADQPNCAISPRRTWTAVDCLLSFIISASSLSSGSRGGNSKTHEALFHII